MSDVTFGTWSVTASPVTVEYSLVVIEEIRHEVAEGFQKLSRGGIEVGGVLYGVHQGPTVRIMAIRPAACEHAAVRPSVFPSGTGRHCASRFARIRRIRGWTAWCASVGTFRTPAPKLP